MIQQVRASIESASPLAQSQSDKEQVSPELSFLSQLLAPTSDQAAPIPQLMTNLTTLPSDSQPAGHSQEEGATQITPLELLLLSSDEAVSPSDPLADSLTGDGTTLSLSLQLIGHSLVAANATSSQEPPEPDLTAQIAAGNSEPAIGSRLEKLAEALSAAHLTIPSLPQGRAEQISPALPSEIAALLKEGERKMYAQQALNGDGLAKAPPAPPIATDKPVIADKDGLALPPEIATLLKEGEGKKDGLALPPGITTLLKEGEGKTAPQPTTNGDTLIKKASGTTNAPLPPTSSSTPSMTTLGSGQQEPSPLPAVDQISQDDNLLRQILAADQSTDKGLSVRDGSITIDTPKPASSLSTLGNSLSLAHASSELSPLSASGQTNSASSGQALPGSYQTHHLSHHSRLTPDSLGLALTIKQSQDKGHQEIRMKVDPPELGRVDVRIESSQDGTSRIVMSAERSETLELLSRDSREIQRSLEQVGIKLGDQGLRFSLSQQNDQQARQQSGQQQGEREPSSAQVIADEPQPHDGEDVLRLVWNSNGLDIRV